jgi:lysyl-tRNA synthetase class 2
VSDDLRDVRLDKLARLREAGLPAYPDRFERTHSLKEAMGLPEGTEGLRLAGRLMAVRTFGKLTFGHIQDFHGRLQIALEKQAVDGETWARFHDLVDIGDFVGVTGDLFVTKKGELTLRVKEFAFLGKALRPLPEKWHGIKDTETQQRQRYLDLVMSPETRERFRIRSATLRAIRRFLDDHGFEEVETPVLATLASGANARPFVTHHNALDMPVYLRIAPETWLKRLIVGGYDRVYEVARSFRNEGMDPSHLQDFTLVEFYAAYWNWEDNLRFTEDLVRSVVKEVLGSEKFTWRGREIDLSGEWPRVDMGTLLLDKTGIDIDAHDEASLRAEIRKLKLEIEPDKLEAAGRGGLIDMLYKQTVRPELIQPCFLTGIPSDALPLARRNDERPELSDCFQLLVNGWEIIKAYSELVDPVEQRARFVEQEELRVGGDDEAMSLDEDYLAAMEHGMPPISGWGIGLERFCSLLTGVDSLRDVTFFPLLRPLETEQPAGEDTSADVGDFGMTREQAVALFRKHIHDDYLTKHCLASAAVMEAIAERFGKNKDTYWCMGLLHDLDFDEVKEPDKHTLRTVELLKEHGVSDPVILDAILAHNWEGLQLVERTKWLDYALSCGETITGLIMAAGKVMPDKKLATLKASSVKKRMKKKDFAKQVSRELILQCEQLDLEIGDFCALALGAMQKIAPELGM